MKASLSVLFVMVNFFARSVHSVKYGCANSDGSDLKIPKGNENGGNKLTFEGFSIKAEADLGAFDVRVHQQNGDAGQICYSHNGGETELEGECPTPLDGIYIQFHPKGLNRLSKVCKFEGIGGPKCRNDERYLKGGECIKVCPKYTWIVGNGKECVCIHGKNADGSCRDKPAENKPAANTPAPVTTNTAVAGCVDLNKQCAAWAAKGECAKNPAYMLVNCRPSCKRCDLVSGCVDLNNQCGAWAASGECGKNPAYMLVNCRPSCKRCQLISGCVDLNNQCGAWAANGECGKNPAYMLVNCRPSCNRCDLVAGCVDLNNQCAAWAANGECGKNPAYMLVNCRPSCNRCDLVPGCVDTNNQCHAWAANGECGKNPAYMLVNCKRSCNRCG